MKNPDSISYAGSVAKSVPYLNLLMVVVGTKQSLGLSPKVFYISF